MYIYVTHASRALHGHDCRQRELAVDLISYMLFFTTLGHGGPPQMSDQFSAGATTETTRTLKTLHIIHSHIQLKQGGY